MPSNLKTVNLKYIKAKVLDTSINKAKYEKIDISHVPVELKEENLKNKDELILKYYTTCLKNKKQPQSTNKQSGRKKVETPSGTNKGRSRQPRGTNGRSQIVVNVPNAVGGGKALPFSINQKRTKMNRKEKKLAVKLLFYDILKKSQIYLIENIESSESDSAFLKYLKLNSSETLKKYLEEPVKNIINDRRFLKRGPLLISETDKDTLIKRFKNFNNLQILTQTKKNYFGALKGYKYPSWVITTRSGLDTFLKSIYNEIPN